MSALLGLVLALLSAAALNWGFFAQHTAASTLPPLSLRRPVASLASLFRSGKWLVGFLSGLGGWAARRFVVASVADANVSTARSPTVLVRT